MSAGRMAATCRPGSPTVATGQGHVHHGPDHDPPPHTTPAQSPLGFDDPDLSPLPPASEGGEESLGDPFGSLGSGHGDPGEETWGHQSTADEPMDIPLPPDRGDDFWTPAMRLIDRRSGESMGQAISRYFHDRNR